MSEEQAKKNWICVIEDEVFCAYPQEVRASMKSSKAVYDDHELLKEDETYMKLYKAYKKAQRALEDFKWEKRYGRN